MLSGSWCTRSPWSSSPSTLMTCPPHVLPHQSMLWLVIIQWVPLEFRTLPVATALLCSLIYLVHHTLVLLWSLHSFELTPQCSLLEHRLYSSLPANVCYLVPFTYGMHMIFPLGSDASVTVPSACWTCCLHLGIIALAMIFSWVAVLPKCHP